MPELPEVETVMRGLAAVLTGQVIERAELRRADLRWPFPPGLAARLAGARVLGFRRRAKYMLMRLDGGDMVLALGAEARREETEFRATDVLKSNDVQGDRASSGALLADSSNTRNAKGIYVEVVAPFTKQWEGQFALRSDRYENLSLEPSLSLPYLYDVTAVEPE